MVQEEMTECFFCGSIVEKGTCHTEPWLFFDSKNWTTHTFSANKCMVCLESETRVSLRQDVPKWVSTLESIVRRLPSISKEVD